MTIQQQDSEDCMECNREIIKLLEGMRRSGKQSSEMLRLLQSRHLDSMEALTCFAESFGFEPAEVWSIRSWFLGRLTDEEVNIRLEQSFAEHRIGGFLTPPRVAKHLNVSLNALREIISRPEFAAQVDTIQYHSDETSGLVSDLMMTPELLAELEQMFPSSSRTPWWWWSRSAKNEDRERVFAGS